MLNQIFTYASEECNGNQKGNQKQQYQQLSLPLYRSQKPQIVSVSGVSPKERDRLTLDQAIKLVKRGVAK